MYYYYKNNTTLEKMEAKIKITDIIINVVNCVNKGYNTYMLFIYSYNKIEVVIVAISLYTLSILGLKTINIITIKIFGKINHHS